MKSYEYLQGYIGWKSKPICQLLENLKLLTDLTRDVDKCNELLKKIPVSNTNLFKYIPQYFTRS